MQGKKKFSARINRLVLGFALSAIGTHSHSQDELGPENPLTNDVLSISADGGGTVNFGSGINYGAAEGGLTIILDVAAAQITDTNSAGVDVLTRNSGATIRSDQAIDAQSFTSVTGPRGLFVRSRGGVPGNATITMGLNAGTVTASLGPALDAYVDSGDGDATVTVNGGTIVSTSTTNTLNFGVRSRVDTGEDGTARITINDGQITTNAAGTFGLYADRFVGTGDSIIEVTGGTITTNGVGSKAVRARHSRGLARVDISGGTLTAAAADSTVVEADSAGGGTASISVSGGTIEAQADNSTGVVAIDGSSAQPGSGATVSVFGNSVIRTLSTSTTVGSTAVQALGLGNGGNVSVFVNSADIDTSSFEGHAISAVQSSATNTANAVIEISGSADIATAGVGADGARSETVGSGDASVSFTSGQVSTQGDGAIGLSSVSTTGMSLISASSGTVETTGVGASVLRASSTSGDSSIVVASGDYTATGVDSSAVVATSDSGSYSVSIGGTANVVASGGSSNAASPGGGFGLHTAGSGSGTISVVAGAIVNASGSGIAIRDGDKDGDGSDELSTGGGDVVVNTAGVLTGAVKKGFGNDVINLTGGSISGDIYGDDNSVGGTADDGDDSFNWTGGSFTGSYRGENGSDTVTISSGATYDGSQTLDGGDDLSALDGFSDSLTIVGQSIASADASLIQNFENITLDATSFTTTGDFTVGAVGESLTGLSLINGATLTPTDPGFSLVGNLDLASSSTLNLEAGAGSGAFTITGNLGNAGIVDLQQGFVGDALSVGGDLTGGGVIQIDVDAANGLADTVVVAGTISGVTDIALNVINAPTADVGNGQILLIDSAAGATAANFSVSGGSATPGTYQVAEQGGDIFLVVTDVEQPPVIPPSGPGANPTPPPPAVNPAPVPSPAPSQPVAPFVATSESVIAEGVVAQLASIERLRSLRGRLGDIVGDDLQLQRFDRGALWSQYQGTFSDQRGSSQGAFHDIDTSEFDFGGAFGVGTFAEGTLLVGVSGHYVRSRLESSLGSLGGKSTTEGAGVGAELTWVADSGFYADAKLRHLWLSSDAEARNGRKFGTDSRVFQLSAEVGRRFELGDGTWITPQAQIQYTSLSADKVISGGTVIALEDGDAVHARVGADFGHTSDDGLITVWTSANLIAELDNGSRFRFGSESLNPNPDDLLFEFGLGGSINLTEFTGIYGEILGGTGVGDTGDDDYIGGNLGVKVAF